MAPREITARDLADLGDERFEQLIASLVFAEHPNAERPSAPDGGADVLLPATSSRRARVWQVKHYPTHRDIAWKKCEDSLDDAVASYDPGEVTFVFPRNLTKPRRDAFEKRLVERHPDITVNHWGLQRIQDELARHPQVSLRYFGEDRADVLPGLLRAVAKSGKELESTRDLADRAFALDAYADVSDPSFDYEVSFGRADMKERLWKDPPFMVVHEIRGDRRVSAKAYLRPEADATASCGFTDDEAGDRARDRVREAFAAGESIELTEGIWVQVQNAPVLAKEAYDSMVEQGYEQACSTLSPSVSTDFTLQLGTSADAPRRTFAVRALPPPKGLQLSFGGIAEGLALFADFALPKPPEVGLNLNISARPVRDPAVNAEVARFMLDFFWADEVFCFAPDLLPDRGLVMSGADKPTATAEDIAHLELLVALFEALTVIERRFGPITPPERFSRREFEEVIIAAQVLTADGGTVGFDELVIELDHNAVEDFVKEAQAGAPGQHPLHVNVFGRRLQAGLAEFKTPRVRFVTTEKGSMPGKTRVHLHTDPANIPFTLSQNPPAPSNSRLWTPSEGPSGLLHRG